MKNTKKKIIKQKNKTKKNKKNTYLQRGGAKSWNEYFKNSPEWQGPYNSSGLEKTFTFFSRMGSSWSSYFYKIFVNYNPYVLLARAAATTAQQVTTSVIKVVEQNKDKIKNLKESINSKTSKEETEESKEEPAEMSKNT
jgi:hypothetical protein